MEVESTMSVKATAAKRLVLTGAGRVPVTNSRMSSCIAAQFGENIDTWSGDSQMRTVASGSTAAR